MRLPQIRSTTMIARRHSVFVLLAFAVLAAYFRLTWLFLFLALFACFLIWNYLWTVLTSRCFSATASSVQENVFAGDSFQMTFHFVNRWIFALARCGLRLYLPVSFSYKSEAPVEQCTDFEGSDQPTQSEGTLSPALLQINAHQTWLQAKGDGSIQLTVNAPRRGCYLLPHALSFVGDPAGLYQSFKRVGKDHTLLVMPKLKGTMDLHKVLSFEENRNEDMFGLDDHYQTIGIRDYQSTDSLKSINWYATARTTSMKANIYQRKVSTSCLVVLDLSCGFQPIIEPHEARVADPILEDAISYACGIALSQLDRGSRTAFYTNAPTLHWEKDEKAPPGSHGTRLSRNRQLTTLDFAEGVDQERDILRLCARIDDTGRATIAAQKKLWSMIQQIPATTLVFLVCYHNPPETWRSTMSVEGMDNMTNPADFYTQERLSEVPSTRVRLLNLSK